MKQIDESSPSNEAQPAKSDQFWQTPTTLGKQVSALTVLLFLAGSFGYLVGVRDDGNPTPTSADVGFLYDMTAHHEQAVQLSMIELNKQSNPAIQAFAREILRSQSYEIGLMRMRLGMWGFDPSKREQDPMAWMGMPLISSDAMPGMADAAELEAFIDAEGSDADALFLALMSDHHAGGVAMAQSAARRANDDWVVDTAERMALGQASEIAEMEFARKAAGLPADPEGFFADDPEATPMDDMDDADN